MLSFPQISFLSPLFCFNFEFINRFIPSAMFLFLATPVSHNINLKVNSLSDALYIDFVYFVFRVKKNLFQTLT